MGRWRALCLSPVFAEHKKKTAVGPKKTHQELVVRALPLRGVFALRACWDGMDAQKVVRSRFGRCHFLAAPVSVSGEI